MLLLAQIGLTLLTPESWYGSMNLLSKDDIEDNIMRVLSKAIAEELLEMTFRKDNDLNEYQLPLDII